MSGSWGPSYIKLDEKHRLILPARVRPALADGTHLTWGQDNCLFLFSESQFEAHREHNRANPPPGMPPIAFDRIFYSSVVSQAMDKQGRISIPPELREYAGLTKDLVFNVLAKRMEIWDAERWRAYVGQYVEQYSQLHEGVR